MENAGNIAPAVPDRWSWWRNALNGEFGPIHENEPQQGYYRAKNKDGSFDPVAIWHDEETGQMLAYRAGKEARPEDIWTWVCRHPVTYEAYQTALEGKGWADDAPVLRNAPDASEDPFDALKIELEGEEELVREFLAKPVNDQKDADKIGVWAKRLTDIKNRGENHRKIEKEPHLEAGRAVDAKWKTITETATDLAARLKKHVEPFLLAQRRAEQERAAAAAREAERLRREAMESDQQSEQERTEKLRAAQEAEAASVAKNASAGRTGAKVSVRVEKIGKVNDYAVAGAALVTMRHPDMIALIDQLANRAAKASMPFAGMEIVEIEKVV